MYPSHSLYFSLPASTLVFRLLFLLSLGICAEAQDQKPIPGPEKFHKWWPDGKPSDEVTPWLSNILRGLKNELGDS